MRNCGMASPFVTWAEGLSTKTVGEDLFFGLHLFWAKNRTKFEWRPFSFLTEDLFFWYSLNFGPNPPFFGLHLILGRKKDLVLKWKIFILFFIILNILKFSGPPPPFENPAYSSAFAVIFFLIFL